MRIHANVWELCGFSFPRFGYPEPGSCQLLIVSVSSHGLGNPRPRIPLDRAGEVRLDPTYQCLVLVSIPGPLLLEPDAIRTEPLGVPMN